MAGKSNGVDMSEWARAPPSGPAWRRCLTAIYNPDEKSFLGRTPKRWVIVFVFYGVFYVVLAILFSLCMGGLMLSIDKDRPTYTLDRSLIGSNPGVAYRPWPLDGFVVGFARENFTMYEEHLDEFFKPYAGDSWFESQTECVANGSYGYPDTPCFYVKLNKIYDWTPDFYDEVDSLPADMPQDLVEHIKLLDPAKRKQVWISCEQERADFITIEYPWGRGLPGRFYPFSKKEGYMSPLVAVRILGPANTLVLVRCRAWAKNVIYNKSYKEPSGYTLIQLYIEHISNSQDDEMTV